MKNKKKNVSREENGIVLKTSDRKQKIVPVEEATEICF